MYLRRYLGIATFILFVQVIILSFYVGANEIAIFETGILFRTVYYAGFIGAFGFWGVMLWDFFGNAEISNRVFWGFGLVFFSWVFAVAYFFRHFLRRNH